MRHLSMCLTAALSMGILQGCASPVVAAGVGNNAMITVTDRRSTAAMVEDDNIESTAHKRIDDKFKDTAHVHITAYDHYALITGSTANEAIKMDIERIVGTLPNVKGIANEVVVNSTPADISASDERLAASIKYRFVKSTAFKADNIKVVTENSVVYLMGMVTHAEADAASEIASTTAGVQRVVRVFEYIDQAQ